MPKLKVAPISDYNFRKSRKVEVLSSPTNTDHKSKANIIELREKNLISKECIQTMDNVEPLKTEEPAKQQDHNETLSDKSSTSIGSIEQRLAAMTSPVKTAAEVRAEQKSEYKLFLSIKRCFLLQYNS